MKVDEDFELLPVMEGDTEPRITTPNEVPLNHMDLQANIKLPHNASFEPRQPWGKKADEVEAGEMLPPKVNFRFSFACDADPEVVFDRIQNE